MIKILLVDDHPSVGEGTKHMIEQEEDMVVTAIHSAGEALQLIKTQSYDLMLFDLNMPVISGLELSKRVISMDPNTIILIYTGYEIGPHFNMLIEAGVSGFINKASTREQLIDAVRCALRGDAVIPISLLKQLRRNEIRVKKAEDNQHIEEVSINEKEQEILQEVANGKSNKEIAAQLLMSQRTVEYNLTRIFEKLSVRSRSEAVSVAKKIGLIQNEEFI